MNTSESHLPHNFTKTHFGMISLKYSTCFVPSVRSFPSAVLSQVLMLDSRPYITEYAGRVSSEMDFGSRTVSAPG